MNQRGATAGSDPPDFVRADTRRMLARRYRELCECFLPVVPDDSKWRYSRPAGPNDPKQGWKLHISATVLTAGQVLKRVGPSLRESGVLFKAPSSLDELARINSGIYYAYSQVGKFITVYPRSDQEAVSLARRLHRLTLGTTAPDVPFDTRFRPRSCVFYRYGAFASVDISNPDGTSTPAMWGPDGTLVPDLRDAGGARPTWVSDIFTTRPRKKKERRTPLMTTFRAFRALAQRGKGGVYQAFDFSVDPPRPCIIKEGRKAGETCWDGRDGWWLVRNEERALKSIVDGGVPVPRVYSSFEVEGNYYLVTEFVQGENLQSWLGRRRKRLSVSEVIRLGGELATTIARLHASGWVWRDCKPANLVVTRDGRLRPLDFEGACSVDHPDPVNWVTPHFAPPECQNEYSRQSRVPEDLYAMGAVVFFMLTGKLAGLQNPIRTSRIRRNAPTALTDIISELLAPDPELRPDAQTVASRFQAIGGGAEGSGFQPGIAGLSRLSEGPELRLGDHCRG